MRTGSRYLFRKSNLNTLRLEGTGTDTMYRHVYNQIDISNLGKYQKVIQKTSSKNFAEANSMLETIEDTNYHETQLRNVLSLYLNRILNDSVLSSEDTAALMEIAEQNYLIGGEAVFIARGILRLEIEDGPLGEARLKKPESAMEPRYFKVHPNPATEWLELVFNENDIVNRIEITDPSGRNVITSNSTKTILLSYLRPGLYFISLYYQNGEKATQKFVKVK